MKPLVLNLCFFLITVVQLTGCTDEMDSKLEYDRIGKMQLTSLAPVNKISVISKDEYYFAVVPCGGSNVFILLNPKFEPLYKQIGSCDYTLTSEDMVLIVKETPILDPTVRECLRSHVTDRN